MILCTFASRSHSTRIGSDISVHSYPSELISIHAEFSTDISNSRGICSILEKQFASDPDTVSVVEWLWFIEAARYKPSWVCMLRTRAFQEVAKVLLLPNIGYVGRRFVGRNRQCTLLCLQRIECDVRTDESKSAKLGTQAVLCLDRRKNNVTPPCGFVTEASQG